MADEAPLILNVDDTEPLRYVKTRTLRSAGFRVEEAGTGAAALELVERLRPDLVLLDVSLPDQSGFEVCRLIKRGWPEVLVLQVSATFTGSTHRVRGLEGGADSYMTQPAEPEELIASTRALLRLRAAERLAQANEARFRALIEASSQIVWTADAAGRIVGDRQAWCRFTGQSPAEAEGEGWLDAVHPADRDRATAAWARALATGTVFETEYRLRHHGGAWRWVQARGVPLREPSRGAAGPVIGWVGMNADIEARKRAEALKAEHQRELEQLVAQRTAELLRASEDRQRAEEAARQNEKLAALGQLTGGVAHDFNNLLMAIAANLELIEEQVAGSDTGRKLIGAATEGAKRGIALTQRLLAFARQQELAVVPVDLGELIEGMSSLLTQSAGSGVEIRTVLPKGLPRALIDANQVELALLNLVVNARDAMPDGGTVTIAVVEVTATLPGARAPAPYLRVTVSDTGIGMDADTLRRATEPFFSTKEVGKGTGLGLSMVHGLAAQLKGQFRLTSTPGRGTTAELLFPAAAEAARRPEPPAAAAAAATSRSISVLMVDDDALIGMTTAMLLKRLGHTVQEAANGPKALEILRQDPGIELMITDYSMPRMNGVELAKAALELRPGLRILLATGYADSPAGEEFALPRLSKPYSAAQLSAAIARVLAG